MDNDFKRRFLERWNKYFPGAELPITYYYADDARKVEKAPPQQEWRCLICQLGAVRNGESLAFDVEAIGCSGGKRYLGFTQTLRPSFRYFLSCGLEGETEGERYKKSPELVDQMLKQHRLIEAPGKYIIFKRFDMLDETDHPLAVVFFAPPDVLSGLFTLANFEEATADGVIVPFGAGCGSIVYHPYHESQSPHPRAVLGMFDPSARPCVPAGVLTFAVPWAKFIEMVNNIDESFLITDTWGKISRRIAGK